MDYLYSLCLGPILEDEFIFKVHSFISYRKKQVAFTPSVEKIKVAAQEKSSNVNGFNHYCRGAMNNKGALSFGRRRGLLAYVYNGVSLTTDPLVVGIGSYIVRPCGHDLHGLTSPFVHQKLSQYWPVLKFTKFCL